MLEEQEASSDELEACENVLVVDPNAEPTVAEDAEAAPAEHLPPPLPAEAERDPGSQLELV